MKKLFYIFLSLLLVASFTFGHIPVAAATSTNLIANPSFETAISGVPSNWHTGNWGTNSATFAYVTNSGHTDTSSVSVAMSSYSSGDAKWYADPVSVSASTTYTYSDYYQSTVNSPVVYALTDASGATTYQALATAPAASSWTNYTATLTTLATTQSVTVYHLLNQVGTLSIDDASLALTVAPTPTPTTGTNLLANPSVEIARTTTQPANWLSSKWGTNTATFTYKTGGHTGNKSLYVKVSNYTSGDAKWYATPVAVTAGQTYTYSDYYQSNVATEYDVALTDASGNTTYAYLGTVAASSTWQQVTKKFIVPTNVVSASVYHLIYANGWLQTDDFSLTQNQVVAPTNFVPNPSLETAVAGAPLDWQTGGWGSNTTAFTYATNDGHTGTSSAILTVSNYVSGDAKWYFAPITTLTAGSQYTFSAWYKTNTQPHVVIAYTDASDTTRYMTIANPLPDSTSATTWQQYTSHFYLPQGTTSVTAFMLLSSNGWLQIDDYSITPYVPVGFSEPLLSVTFDDGWQSIYTNGLPLLEKYGLLSTQYISTGALNTPNYMTSAMVSAFQAQGSEIGAHTVTHPDLTTLSLPQLTNELSQSQATLQTLFGPAVAHDFASPYGTYDPTVLATIRQYYQSHRSTDVGYNSKDSFNPYDIIVQDVGLNTSPAQVAEWVAKAQATNTWLVLVYHQVTTSTSNGDYSITPAELDLEFANIKASGITVKTMSQALAEVTAQL